MITDRARKWREERKREGGEKKWRAAVA